MAKDKNLNLPSADGVKPITVSASDSVPQPDDTHIVKVVIEGYLPRRVDARLTRAQAIKLRDKLRLLQDTGAKTADGRFVSNRTQALQWIIENEISL